MAQKAAKSLAIRNGSTLTRTHLITLTLHILFHLLRLTLLSSKSRTLTPYIILTAPSLILEVFLDTTSRPSYTTSPSGDRTLKSAGQDLDAKGLTEYFWDVIYWTWINLLLVIVFGNRAWLLYIVVPGYSVYLAVTTVGGVKGMLSGLGGAGEGMAASGGQSKREAKREKRGGQKVAYR